MTSRISECRVCGGSLEERLDFGQVPLSGRFPLPGEEVPRHPLLLVECQGPCHLVQLAHSAPLPEMYGEHYGYRSGLNQGMVAHLKDLADRVTPLLGPGDIALDIGSNDGTFLSMLPPHAMRVGVDPTTNRFIRHLPPDVYFINDFFPTPRLHAIIDSRPVKVVTTVAMFYDLERPVEFAKQIHRLLAEDGVWIIEVADWPRLMKMGAFDTICHEHLEYYGLNQLRYIAHEAGFKIISWKSNDTNGGSLQFVLSKCGVMCDAPDGPLPWQEFLVGLVNRKAQLLDLLGHHKKVIGLGASTKGNILLHYYGLDSHHLPHIVDVNPDKWGHETSCGRIPIVSPQEGEERGWDVGLVLPWHFRDSIVERAVGKKLIFPLPEVEEVQG